MVQRKKINSWGQSRPLYSKNRVCLVLNTQPPTIRLCIWGDSLRGEALWLRWTTGIWFESSNTRQTQGRDVDTQTRGAPFHSLFQWQFQPSSVDKKYSGFCVDHLKKGLHLQSPYIPLQLLCFAFLHTHLHNTESKWDFNINNSLSLVTLQPHFSLSTATAYNSSFFPFPSQTHTGRISSLKNNFNNVR